MHDTPPETTLEAPPDPSDLPARVAWLEARYLKNARDDGFLECLQEIMQVGADGALMPRPARDPLNGETVGMRVIGASGDGKSVMICRNLAALPGFAQMTDGTSGNYIHITVSPEATIKSLASDILTATGYNRLSGQAKAHEAWAIARHRLEMLGVGMIWIDEAHHMLRGGPGRDMAGALQTLKNLLQGQGAVAVVLSGVPQLDERIAADPETFRRYSVQLRLRPVAPGGKDLERLKRFVELCCTKLDLGLPADPFFAERIVFSQREALGRSIAFAKATIRRVVIGRRREVSLEDARRIWILHGGDQGGTTPFDDGDWAGLRALLEARGW